MPLSSEQQKDLNECEDLKLAIDGMRAVFRVNGKLQPKHRKALEVLARFCKVVREGSGTYVINHGTDPTEIIRMTGRQEVYNYILYCLDYPVRERRKLVTEIKNLEDIRDARRSDSDDD